MSNAGDIAENYKNFKQETKLRIRENRTAIDGKRLVEDF